VKTNFVAFSSVSVKSVRHPQVQASLFNLPSGVLPSHASLSGTRHTRFGGIGGGSNCLIVLPVWLSGSDEKPLFVVVVCGKPLRIGLRGSDHFLQVHGCGLRVCSKVHESNGSGHSQTLEGSPLSEHSTRFGAAGCAASIAGYEVLIQSS